MKSSSERIVIAGVVLGAFLLITTGIGSYTIVHNGNIAAELVQQSNEAALRLEQMLSSLKDSETGQRGYLLTGADKYLAPYQLGVEAVNKDLIVLNEILPAAGISAEEFSGIDQKVQQKFAELERTVSLRRNGDYDAALAIVKTDQGRQLMDDLRINVSQIETKLLARLNEDKLMAERARANAIWANGTRTFILFGFLLTFAALVLRDLRLRRKAELELAEQQEWFQTTLLSIGDGVIATDAQGNIVLMNSVAEKISGWTLADAKGKPHEEIFKISNAETHRTVESPVNRVIREGIVVGLANHTVLIDRSGVAHPIDDSGAPIWGREKDLIGVVLVFRDVSDRYRAEAAVREKDAQLNIIFNQVMVGIAQTDLEGRYTLVNARYCEILGRPMGDVLGAHLQDFIHPEDRASQLSLENEKNNLTREERYVLPNGSTVWVNNSVKSISEAEHIVGILSVIEDVTERKRAQTERDRLVAVVQNSSDFISIADLEAKSTFINQAGKRLLGIDPQHDILGTPLSEFFMEQDRAVVQDTVIPAVKENGQWSGELHFRNFTTQAAIPVLYDMFRIDDPKSGQAINYAAVSRDITERKRAEQERERLLAGERTARSDAERTSRVKDEFVATLSHELRTPLNAILGWAQLLRNGKREPAELSNGLETIERNARIQSQMIEDLLDMSGIISGKVRLDVQRVELLEVINASIDAIRPAANARGIRIETVLDPRTNIVNGDPTRLQQVVWNLLSNAVKFTPKDGKVQIVLSRINSHVEISVSDTGKGIKAEFISHVFERFRQEDSSTTRKFGGLGLGLAIAKQLVELHGGSVRATSAGEGLGATFTVEIPLAVFKGAKSASDRTQPVTPRSLPITAVGFGLEGVKVLVVDDELDSRELVRYILSELKAEVVATGSVKEALEVFSEFRPDVVLSDIGMPDQDGYQLMKKIRSLPLKDGGSTPAAALTALARSEDRTRALLSGFQVHVSKPIEASELVAVVASLAGISAERRGLKE